MINDKVLAPTFSMIRFYLGISTGICSDDRNQFKIERDRFVPEQSDMADLMVTEISNDLKRFGEEIAADHIRNMIRKYPCPCTSSPMDF